MILNDGLIWVAKNSPGGKPARRRKGAGYSLLCFAYPRVSLAPPEVHMPPWLGANFKLKLRNLIDQTFCLYGLQLGNTFNCSIVTSTGQFNTEKLNITLEWYT